MIIQRLDQLELLIQQQQQSITESTKPKQRVDPRADDIATIKTSSSAVIDGDASTLIGSPLYYSSDLSRVTIETILSWSVFEGKFDSSTNLKALVISPTVSGEPFLTKSDPRLERLDLDLETCTRLLHIFLEHVHIANPILDVPLITDYLYQACVHGIGWDAPSCLVVRLSLFLISHHHS